MTPEELVEIKELRELFETQTGLYEQAVSDRARLTDERDEAWALAHERGIEDGELEADNARLWEALKVKRIYAECGCPCVYKAQVLHYEDCESHDSTECPICDH